MNELISIIVPIYNVEEYLVKCLDSIVNQTYSNLEIILIDDGSTDNSGKICDEYASKDDRIIIIHQVNSGVSNARNKGLKIAQGNYIGFVDPDDYIEKEMYEQLLNDITKNYCDIAVCGVNNISYNTQKIICKNAREKDKMMEKTIFFEKILRGIETETVWNKLYSRNSIVNTFFDEKLKKSEDLEWLFQIIEKNNKLTIYKNSKKLYNWIQRESSAMNNEITYRANIEASLLVLSRIKETIKQKYPNLYASALRKVLVENIMAYNRVNDIQNEQYIYKLKKEYFRQKKVKLKEKVKIIVQCKFPKLYTKTKKFKDKIYTYF